MTSAELDPPSGGAAIGARRAALVLHPLAAPDRAWVLKRLDAAQRSRLTALLAELDAMGVRFDAADVEALCAAPAKPAATTEDVLQDWQILLPDEPPWVWAVLRGDGAVCTPAARQALLSAAEHHRGGDRSAPAQPRDAGPWPPASRRGWFMGALKWLP